jgi:hypothetical protein
MSKDPFLQKLYKNCTWVDDESYCFITDSIHSLVLLCTPTRTKEGNVSHNFKELSCVSCVRVKVHSLLAKTRRATSLQMMIHSWIP